MLGQLKLLGQIAARNILASPSSWLVGGIVFFTALLVVLGSAVISGVDAAVSRSVADSLTGELQGYSAASKDELDLFGALENLPPRLSPITDFPKVQAALKTANVKAIVPMGVALSHLTADTPLDVALARLRDAARDEQAGRPVPPEVLDSRKRHVRQIAQVLLQDLSAAKTLLAGAEQAENLAALQRATSDAFWAEEFPKDAFAALEFLENRVAPQLTIGEPIELGQLGTDLDAFRAVSTRFEIADGVDVPAGQRGLLVSKYFYEEKLKLKNALRLDKIKAERARGSTIAEDAQLSLWVKENQTQVRELILQLDDLKTAELTRLLQEHLSSKEEKLRPLLVEFFSVTDENFDARYAFFYEKIAPLLQLYRVRLGEPLVLRSTTDRGMVQSARVTVYGSFQFRGLGNSDFVGTLNLMDLVTFRQLYGFQGAGDVEEEAALAAELQKIDANTPPETFDASLLFQGNGSAPKEGERPDRRYTSAELAQGPVLNFGIWLHDPELADETLANLEEIAASQNLGIKLATWQSAGGTLGSIAVLATILLFVAVFVIFLVSLIVINNAVMMATLRRTQEIGTIRAIGGQRGFVLQLILLESVTLGLVFGALGGLAGLAVVAWLGRVGIPAADEALNFLFGGDRLFPTPTVGHLILACVVTVVINSISTLSPAAHAARISPLRAMQTEE